MVHFGKCCVAAQCGSDLRRGLIWIVALLLPLAVGACSDRQAADDRKPPGAGQKRDAADNSATDDHAMTDHHVDPPGEITVDALASKNPKPMIDARRDAVIFSPDFDWNEQERVIHSWKMVYQNVETLIDSIVEHVDDDRYSLTFVGLSGRWSNNTVGDICYIILYDSIAVYKLAPGTINREGREEYPPDIVDIKKWWHERPDKSIVSMQIELCEHLKKLLGERDRADDERRGRAGLDYAKIIDEVSRIEDKLRLSGMPIKRRFSLEPYYFENHPPSEDEPRLPDN